MGIYEIYFSPTGGTKKVADILTDELGGALDTIDLCEYGKKFEKCVLDNSDVGIIAVPSYGGRVPSTAVERISRINGGGAKAVLVAVYGNRAYEDILLELKDTTEKAGFKCVAAVAAVAEHSIMRQFAAGRPDMEDASELRKFASEIRGKLDVKAKETELKVPGNRPFKEYKGIAIKPKASEKCIKCGLCAAKCPVNAISDDNPSETDESICISCMRCVAVCPRNARDLNADMLAAMTRKMEKAFEGRKKNEIFI